MLIKEDILSALKTVYDPELAINVVDLGLIYDLLIDEDNNIEVIMTLTTPGCPLHDSIINGVKHVLEAIPDSKRADVKLVWQPPWSPERMNKEAIRRLQGF